jgi:hypothetical protein
VNSGERAPESPELGRADLARPIMRANLALAAEDGSVQLEGWALCALGWIEGVYLGKHAEALEWLARSAALLAKVQRCRTAP